MWNLPAKQASHLLQQDGDRYIVLLVLTFPPAATTRASVAHVSQRLQPKFIRAQSAVPRATMRLLFLGEEHFCISSGMVLSENFSPTSTSCEETRAGRESKQRLSRPDQARLRVGRMKGKQFYSKDKPPWHQGP